ncbi:MarR family winged helix-turn-helix transcriptional regulator [Streptomyces sp. LE64]|jgi:DNA-binding MarR family transcriptional regulator|uniref:MarR family winged helix-turn-helix transcriptional regulator n=1 Tax=unclassified Streptomyces TaxID=2593676 RepID=UPI00331A3D05
MAARSAYAELVRQLNAVGAVNRGLARLLPADCPAGAAAVLHVLAREGELRSGRLAELLAVDPSVSSRHVTHVTDRGWVARSPDPLDGRSRLLRLTSSGEAQLADLRARCTRDLARRLGDWSEDEITQLTTLLARLRAEFDGPRTTGAPTANGGREQERTRA